MFHLVNRDLKVSFGDTVGDRHSKANVTHSLVQLHLILDDPSSTFTVFGSALESVDDLVVAPAVALSDGEQNSFIVG